jgi:hypothetical protein
MSHIQLSVLCTLWICFGSVVAGDSAWPAGKTYDLSGLKVTISAPRLVSRSYTGHYWFPHLVRLANGELIAHVSLDADQVGEERGEVLWSRDGGLNWGDAQHFPTPSETQLLLPNGDLLFLPSRLYPRRDGMSGPNNIIPNGKHAIIPPSNRDSITVTGWPRPRFVRADAAALGQDGFGFDGTPVRLKDGKFLVTLYGTFQPEVKKNFRYRESGGEWAFVSDDGQDYLRYSVVVAESDDGYHWKIRSVVADEKCKLPGNEGPCEATLCRLKDGRLMCLFRLAGCCTTKKNSPIAESFSSDEGRTWSEAVSTENAFAVDPRVAVMKDGTLALTSGRPDINLWLNADGTGKGWQPIDLLAHHNAFQPQEPIQRNDTQGWAYYGGRSTGYTEVVAIDDQNVLIVYDRTAASSTWTSPLPPKDTKDPAESFSVWILRATVKRDGK